MFNNIDVRSFEIAIKAKEEQIELMSSHIAWLEDEVERQRRRADIAVDRLLAIQKIPTVMPENIKFISDKEAADISEQRKAMEVLKSELEKIGEIAEAESPSKTQVEEIQ